METSVRSPDICPSINYLHEFHALLNGVYVVCIHCWYSIQQLEYVYVLLRIPYHLWLTFHSHLAGQTSIRGVGSPTTAALRQTHHPVSHIWTPGPYVEPSDQETEYWNIDTRDIYNFQLHMVRESMNIALPLGTYMYQNDFKAAFFWFTSNGFIATFKMLYKGSIDMKLTILP